MTKIPGAEWAKEFMAVLRAWQGPTEHAQEPELSYAFKGLCLTVCALDSSGAVIKHSDKVNLREKGLFSS